MEGKLPSRLTIDGPLPFNLQKSEQRFWLFPNTDYYEQKTKNQYFGGHQVVSFRVAKGVYYRVSAFKGQPVTITETVHSANGVLGLINKHVYFTGCNKSFRVKYDKIVSFTPYSDGFGIQRDSTTAKPQSFVIGNGWFVYNLVTNLAKTIKILNIRPHHLKMEIHMEPKTALAIFGGAETIRKFFGPSIEYMGEEFRDHIVKPGILNIKSIIDKAIIKLGDRINDEGQIPPRVLQSLITEGVFCEDALTQEYYAGILASSRTILGRDDQAKTYMTLLSQMSNYQIRTHYVLYATLRHKYLGVNKNLADVVERSSCRTYIPESLYRESMDFSADEIYEHIFFHSYIGLTRLSLLSVEFYGRKEHLHTRVSNQLPEGGFIYTPTTSGVELYLWANGKRDLVVHDFLRTDIGIEVSPKVKIDYEKAIII